MRVELLRKLLAQFQRVALNQAVAHSGQPSIAKQPGRPSASTPSQLCSRPPAPSKTSTVYILTFAPTMWAGQEMDALWPSPNARRAAPDQRARGPPAFQPHTPESAYKIRRVGPMNTRCVPPNGCSSLSCASHGVGLPSTIWFVARTWSAILVASNTAARRSGLASLGMTRRPSLHRGTAQLRCSYHPAVLGGASTPCESRRTPRQNTPIGTEGNSDATQDKRR